MSDYIWERGYPDNIPSEVVVKISTMLPGYVKRMVYKKIQLATDRNSRILLQENNDIRAALDIAQQMEMAAKRLLDRWRTNGKAKRRGDSIATSPCRFVTRSIFFFNLHGTKEA